MPISPSATMARIERARRLRLQRRLAERCAPGPLQEYYHRGEKNWADPSASWRELDFVVLDVETTGLDPSTDHLLSLGWVMVTDGVVAANSARHAYVRLPSTAEVGQSARVHHITDTEAAAGTETIRVVGDLLGALAGRVLVCHFAMMELGFLSAVTRQWWGVEFRPVQVIDTLEWHLRHARLTGQAVAADELRLASLTDRYDLVSTRQHDALSDAFATALVFMAVAQRHHRDAPLGELLT